MVFNPQAPHNLHRLGLSFCHGLPNHVHYSPTPGTELHQLGIPHIINNTCNVGYGAVGNLASVPMKSNWI
jgi:hypothetical protein